MSHHVLGQMVRTRSYLVLVPEAVIATDLAQTIALFDPGAEVICVRSMVEAEAALPLVDAVEIAFVAGCPSRFVDSALHRGIAERGGRVVMLGIEAEVAGPTPVFDVLPQPFDTDAVLTKLMAGHLKGGPPVFRMTLVRSVN